MVKFWHRQSWREKGVDKVWHVSASHGMPVAPQNVPNYANPFFFELLLGWNFINAKSWFLKGSPTDFAQKAQAVCEIWFFKVGKLKKS